MAFNLIFLFNQLTIFAYFDFLVVIVLINTFLLLSCPNTFLKVLKYYSFFPLNSTVDTNAYRTIICTTKYKLKTLIMKHGLPAARYNSTAVHKACPYTVI